MNFLEKLDKKNLKITEIIKKEALKQGVNVYIVGGVVRDIILGREVKDVDFLVEGSAVQFAHNANFKIKSTHEAFNTVKVLIDDEEIDIASTRKEIYKQEGALPTVIETGVKIEEDLKRRDFTINSIAFNILNGQITDTFSGIEDIKNKRLKVLHKKSFLDDPTRILRGLDFKYRLGFSFEQKTLELIKECVNNFNNEGLSIDRIYLTLNKVFSFPYSDEILKEILTEKIYKIWMKKTDLTLNDIELLKESEKIFKVKERTKLFISALESTFYIKPFLKDEFEIYEFFKKFNDVQLALYYFKTSDKNAIKYLEIKDISVFLTGDDLIKEGYPQGKIIGNILKALLRKKVLKKLKTKEDEIKFVKENFKL